MSKIFSITCVHAPVNCNTPSTDHKQTSLHSFPITKILCFSYLAFAMCCMLSSHGLVLATAMAVSAGTIFLFDVFKEKYFSNLHIRQNKDFPAPHKRALKSCLVSNSGSKKSDRPKKKRVKFSEDVKLSVSDKNINGGSYFKEERKFGGIQRRCGNEMVGIQKMPANHIALYSGILRDRVHRMQYSH